MHKKASAFVFQNFAVRIWVLRMFNDPDFNFMSLVYGIWNCGFRHGAHESAFNGQNMIAGLFFIVQAVLLSL